MSAAQGTTQAPQDARTRRRSSVFITPSWFKSVQLNGKHGGGDDVTNTEVGGAVVVMVDEGAPVRRMLVKDVNNEDIETVLFDVGKTIHTPVVIEHTAPFTQNPHVFPELPHCPDVCNTKGTQLPFEQHPCWHETSEQTGGVVVVSVVDVVVVEIAVSVEALAVDVVAAAFLHETIPLPKQESNWDRIVVEVTIVQAASVKFCAVAEVGPQVYF